MLKSIRAKILILTLVNVIIFSYIYFFYSPSLPLNNNVIVSSSLRSEFDINTQKDDNYLTGYIKNFSPNKLNDVSVHIEYYTFKENIIVTKNIGELDAGEVKTYMMKISEKDIEIYKEWATFKIIKHS